jgi:hypothetical protein
MSKVPLPERGQPIDVSYVYQLTNAINQISDQLTSVGYNYTTVDTPSAGKQNVETANARIIGGSVVVTSGEDQARNSTKPFNYSYNNNFKYPPIVTATVVNSGVIGTAGAGATVVLTNVDQNSLSGIVRFDASGKASVSVNLIIVGIPAK